MPDDFWNISAVYSGPPLTEEMIVAAEELLGYKLPEAYLQLMRAHNGGTPQRDCFRTAVARSWSDDHISICGLRGIGGEWGIDAPALGSRAMIAQWSYPNIGIVIGETPLGGRDTIMLDYSECGPQGEPRVVHIDLDAEPQLLVLAPDFAQFIAQLVDGDEFD